MDHTRIQQTWAQFLLRMDAVRPAAEIAATLEETAKSHGFSVLGSYPFQEILQTKGFPIQRAAFNVNICHAPTAQEILTRQPEFGIFMPCTLSVYEENGRSVVATLNMDSLLPSMVADPDLLARLQAMFARMRDLMKDLAA